MINPNVLDHLLSLICEIGMVSRHSLTANRRVATIGMDSMQMMQLIIDLETNLQLELGDDTMEAILCAATIGEMGEAVERQMSPGGPRTRWV